MERIGLIGVGLLGTALAERLLKNGYAVVGHDVREERQAALQALGGEVADSPMELARRCRRLVLSLPDSNVVEAVLGELESAVRPGQALLDTTTGDPDRMAAIGTRLATKGIVYVDGCILGSSEQARAGEAIVMAGGDPSAISDNEDLFRCFSRRWFHVGGHGGGARMKLVVNLVLGLNRAVLAEGLAFAKASGLDLAMTLEVLRAGGAYSRVMDTKGEKMLRRDFRPQARLAQHLKDVRLILDQAAQLAASVPLSETHRGLLERVVAMGAGEEDNSAVLRAYDTPPS